MSRTYDDWLQEVEGMPKIYPRMIFNRCLVCPDLHRSFGMDTYYCKHPKRNYDHLCEHDIFERVPDWCPLEDALEVEQVELKDTLREAMKTEGQEDIEDLEDQVEQLEFFMVYMKNSLTGGKINE